MTHNIYLLSPILLAKFKPFSLLISSIFFKYYLAILFYFKVFGFRF